VLSKVGSLNGRVKARLSHGRLTLQGLGNACIHSSLVFFAVYAITIDAVLLDKPELRYDIAHLA
jgi:hypothetical protein